MKNAKLFLECRKSQKTGNTYRVLTLDLGFRKVNLTMDTTSICDICDVLPKELYSMGIGEVKEIAIVNSVK